jgi:alkylmercury lyase
MTADTSTPTAPTVDQLAGEIIETTSRLDETSQRIGVALIRCLARGVPVAAGVLAGEAGLPEAEVTGRLDRMPWVYRDEAGRVAGYFGITVAEMGKHRLHLDGHTVSAWCAWDTLFLPDVIGRTVQVTSRTPDHDDPISLTVTPDGLRDVTPPGTVVTFVSPKADFIDDPIANFCHYVHFFPSAESAAGWTAQHPGTFAVSLAEAYQLAEVLTQTVFGNIVPPRQQRTAEQDPGSAGPGEADSHPGGINVAPQRPG